MSVIGKKFICRNCKTEVTLTSEGTSFVCPNCKTLNSIPVVTVRKFTCGNCKTQVQVSGEGTSFVCPKCNTQNTIPGVKAGPPMSQSQALFKVIIFIVAVIAIIYALKVLFS